MDLYEVADQIVKLLQQRGRLTYRVLKLQFKLDDETLDALKDELLFSHPVVDEDGRGLVWIGEIEEQLPPSAQSTIAPIAPPSTQQEREPLSYTPRHLAEKILTSRSALQGERKQVTVLFADTAGFTALARQLDPEVVHEVMDHCFGLLTDEVHRFEGTINQYTGDGIMALFGAPIAHEDSPRRAVHAALAIQRAMRDFGRQLEAERGFSLQMRIGLNTGLVVVGKIGDDLRMDYTAVGDTTNLAARLQQLAQPGTVVIGETTHRQVEGFFETHDLGVHHVKGHEVPVRVYEVLRARGRRTRLQVAAEHGLTPLTGRQRELSALLDRFQQVVMGQGQVVFLVGEAGAGKSRHLLEFHQALHTAGQPMTWLEGRCLSFGQNMPFLPLIDQLRSNFGIDEADGEPEIIAKVEDRMRHMGELDMHIPAIRYLLAVDTGDAILTDMQPATRRKRLVEAALSLALRGAQLQPLILIYEDLHWIDTSTEEYLASLLDAVAGAPILLIMTYRPGYSPPFGSRSFYTTLSLQALSEADTLAMATRILGTAQLPEGLATLLVEKTEGVPLFVEEVIKALLDVGILRYQDGAVELLAEHAEVNVPDTIQDMIMARLDHLGEAGKRMVQLASVIGRQFLVRLLERVSDLSGELDGLLAELQALEIVYRQGLLPEPSYVFKHAVIQDVAYNSLLVRQRRDLHRLVGEAIEELYPERLTEHYEELAHHFTQGEVWSKAMTYSMLAGDRAAASYANAEAESHYAQALKAAEHLTPPPESGVVARLQAKQGDACFVLGKSDAAFAAYQSALAFFRQAGDQQGEIEVLHRVSHACIFFHRPEQAIASVEQALTLSRARDDRAAQSLSLAYRAWAQSAGYGRLAEALPDAEMAVQFASDIEEPQLLVQTYVVLGQALQWHGDYDRAVSYLCDVFDLAQREHMGHWLGGAMFNIGHACASRGRYEEALQWYQRLSDYATAAGDNSFIIRAPNLMGGVYLDLFDLDAALQYNLEGDEVAQRLSPWPEPRGHSLVKAALAYFYRDQHGQAEACLRRAMSLLEKDRWLRWRWHMPLLWARGALALAEGLHDDAWTYATQSLELATRTASRKHIVRAQRLQGDILAATDQLEKAVQALTASIRLADLIAVSPQVWLGKAALGKVLMRMNRDLEAEAQLTEAMYTIESIIGDLRKPRLRDCFLNAVPVVELYDRLGRRPPTVTS